MPHPPISDDLPPDSKANAFFHVSGRNSEPRRDTPKTLKRTYRFRVVRIDSRNKRQNVDQFEDEQTARLCFRGCRTSPLRTYRRCRFELQMLPTEAVIATLQHTSLD